MKSRLVKIILKWVFAVFLAVSIAVGVLYVIYLGYIKRIEKLSDPPSNNYVEEDLEMVFLTNSVIVLGMKQEYEYAFYTVEANGYYYIVLYRFKNLKYGGYAWQYERYVPINENEVEE